MNYTTLETRVYNCLATASMNGAAMDGRDLCDELEINRRSIGGVLSSLVKKGKVIVDDEVAPCSDLPIVWPIHPTNEKASGGFWCDSLTDEEFEAALLPDTGSVRSEDEAEYMAEALSIETDRENAIIEQAQKIIESRLRQKGSALTSPDQTRRFLQVQQHGQTREHFACLFLDTRHRVLSYEVLFSGTIDAAHVHPRIVVERALMAGAAAVIVTHNHPSGSPEPSQADLAITRRLRDALNLLDIRLLDHFIAGDGGVVSLAERGLV